MGTKWVHTSLISHTLNELGYKISSRKIKIKIQKRVLKRKQRWESHERSQNRGHWNGIEIKQKGEYKQAQDPKNQRKYSVNTFKYPDRTSFDIQISPWKGHEHGKINIAMEIIPESPSSSKWSHPPHSSSKLPSKKTLCTLSFAESPPTALNPQYLLYRSPKKPHSPLLIKNNLSLSKTQSKLNLLQRNNISLYLLKQLSEIPPPFSR